MDMENSPSFTNGSPSPSSGPDLVDPIGAPVGEGEKAIPFLTAAQIQGFVADLFAAFAPRDREERVRAAVNHPVVGALLTAIGYEEALAHYAARLGASTLSPAQSLFLGTGLLVGSGLLGLALARLGEGREAKETSEDPVDPDVIRMAPDRHLWGGE
jgi:hypothetical protein